MSNEKLLERKLREAVAKAGGWAVKFWAVSISGFPDRIILLPQGRVSFVELKSTGKKPTAIQQAIIIKLRNLGFEVYVIDSEELLQQFLNQLTK